ncbi:DUF692 family multinuclear iron-containing protein [Oryzobacter terrae]|uniref:DUF692 domain-containing protein n=1 Tax=Oryzobacter terrae TaxID=1620385 RepID=UPI0036734676
MTPPPSHLDLGVGLIVTGGVDLLWHEVEDLVDVLEVEPQTLWDGNDGRGRRIARDALRWLRSTQRPLLSHGVGYPVGGTCPPDPDGVAAAALSAREVEASHWSEHLSFNRVGAPGSERYAGYLLPPVPTPESAAAAVGHVGRYQDRWDAPFLVETPTSYVRATPGDLTDGEYVATVARGADCGILLDLHNIWANELNGRQRVEDFLASIPLDRVREVHVAGGDSLGDVYLDSHVGPVAPEVLEIARGVLPRLPNVRAVLFEAVPHSIATLGAAGLRGVLADIHEVVDGARAGGVTVPSATAATGPGSPPPQGPTGDGGATARREAALLDYTTRAAERLDTPDPGADALRHLTDQARLSLLVGTHRAELATLVTRLGPDGARAALGRFLARAPATAWSGEQGPAFEAWYADLLAAEPALTEPAPAARS